MSSSSGSLACHRLPGIPETESFHSARIAAMPHRSRLSPGGNTMKFPRRTFFYLAAGAAALLVLPHIARAQDYPARSVTLIVPWATAGAVDTVARIVGPKLAERLGKP